MKMILVIYHEKSVCKFLKNIVIENRHFFFVKAVIFHAKYSYVAYVGVRIKFFLNLLSSKRN